MDRLAKERRARLMAERRLTRAQPVAGLDVTRPQIAGILDLAQRLARTSLTAEQQDLVQQLTLLAKDATAKLDLTAGHFTLAPAPFDLEEAIHAEAVQVRRKGVDVLIDYDTALPTRFDGDVDHLRQILSRLIGNAVRFTEAGHVLIRIIGVAQDADRRTLHITVQDTGSGIADMGPIFDAGGLATARTIARCMGGEIWAESEAGRGSCFGFRITLDALGAARSANLPSTLRRALVVDDRFISRAIPAKLLAQVEVRQCRSTAEAMALLADDADFDVVIAGDDGIRTTLPVVVLEKPFLRSTLYDALRALPVRHRRMRVLAADDNRTNQLVLRKMVRDLALDMEVASDGSEAVEVARKFAPDLIFMDIAMPGMTGAEAARLIRSGGLPHVPIIALAAPLAGEGDTAIDFHIPKPLRKSTILTMLERFRPEGTAPLVEETRPLPGVTG